MSPTTFLSRRLERNDPAEIAPGVARSLPGASRTAVEGIDSSETINTAPPTPTPVLPEAPAWGRKRPAEFGEGAEPRRAMSGHAALARERRLTGASRTLGSRAKEPSYGSNSAAGHLGFGRTGSRIGRTMQPSLARRDQWSSS